MRDSRRQRGGSGQGRGAAKLANRAGIPVATIERRLAAIGRMHREAEIDPPPTPALEVHRGITGIRRTLGTAPWNARVPLSVDELRRLLFSFDPATLAVSVPLSSI